MSIGPGSRVGPYEIVAPLGAGGMGEVWRGRDARLGRDVAIKVLPAALASDPERRARFERECRLLASLNHPHIAAVLGLEDANGSPALVMELVEGQTLAERLDAHGAIELGEALALARQIAEAVEFAHERGIVHRDLKPGNIKLTPDGAAKVLDFGLAKALAAEDGSSQSSPQITQSPTMSVGTQAGVLLGTAAYMAPEQARGKAVDKRADIWAFGVVLFEMLSGRQLFAGETVSDTIARILERQPEWATLPARTPVRVRELLRRCLEKDAKQRLRDVGDARLELEAAIAQLSSGVSDAPAATPESRAQSQKRMLGVTALAMLFGALALAGGFALRGLVQPRETLHVSIVPPDDVVMGAIQFGFGDDRAMYGAGNVRGTDSPLASAVYRRTLDEFQWKKIPGTEGRVAWDVGMDGRWIYVLRSVAQGSRQLEIARVPMDGSAPPAVVVSFPENSGAWDVLPDGRVLVFNDGPKKQFAVLSPGDTGAPAWKPVKSGVAIVELNANESLPDGTGALLTLGYYKGSAWLISVAVFEIATGEVRVIEENAGSPQLFTGGQILMTRGTSLLAAPWNASKRQLGGRPVVVMQGLRTTMSWEHARVAASRRGDAGFVLGGVTSQDRRLTIVHADGRTEPWNEEHRPISSGPKASLDGRYALVSVAPPGGSVFDLLLFERGRAGVKRFASIPEADCTAPAFSRDGRLVAWTVLGGLDVGGLYLQPFDGSAPARKLLRARPAPDGEFALDWYPDGRSILVMSTNDGRRSLKRVALEGDSVTVHDVLTGMSYPVMDGRLSPDGQRIAYLSFENGDPEIFVARLMSDGRAGPGVSVSRGYGQNPNWLDGGTVLWTTRKRVVMASQVSPSLDVSAPVQRTDIAPLVSGESGFAVLPGGDLLVTQKGDGEGEVRHFEVALGFDRELKRLIQKATGGR
ncbi:MAG: serine/threonine-protein kinase [Candidatus Eisenbacteria bacterium]|uniref:Serine/threonine-protein kinase n=1 Tax=Eiseniibacteriota bacterium TaxID=2212470 RepID=A0A933SD52_UNCEI|nr:serine/threonine-protein kinase [Candidatus Eisenbacteria bacterium]